jgi:hypothetical protein
MSGGAVRGASFYEVPYFGWFRSCGEVEAVVVVNGDLNDYMTY